MVRFVLRPLPKFQERFARRYRNEPSPEIPLTLLFSGIFVVFPCVTLTQTTLKITVSGSVHVCVRVCMWKNTENPEEEKRNACGMGVCVV